MKRIIRKGKQDVSLQVFVMDSSSSTGAGLTGLAYDTSNLQLYYARVGGVSTQISLVTQTVTGAHVDGGFVEIDDTNMPGFYRLDIPDACVATGAESVSFMLMGATNMAPVPFEIDIDVIAQTEYEVLNATMSSYTTAGTMGKLLNDLEDMISVDGVALSTAEKESIANTLLLYDLADVEDSAGLNTPTGALLRILHWTLSGLTLSIKKTTGSEFATQTVTTGSASPIVAVE